MESGDNDDEIEKVEKGEQKSLLCLFVKMWNKFLRRRGKMKKPKVTLKMRRKLQKKNKAIAIKELAR